MMKMKRQKAKWSAVLTSAAMLMLLYGKAVP